MPTETVYGLAAHALDPAAVARIYAAKGRPAWNPLIVHVADAEAARRLTRHWPPSAQRLADAFWPGPLTIVLHKQPQVPDIVTAGSDTIALRVPAHPAALALLRVCELPLAAPSANRFTQLSPTTAQHVEQALGDRVSLILDGGACDIGIESTVIDLTTDPPTLLRPGLLALTSCPTCWARPFAFRDTEVTAPDNPPDQAPENAAKEAPDGSTPHRSPGLSERHYAPRADVWLAARSEQGEVQDMLDRLPPEARIGVLAIERGLQLAGAHRTLVLPDNPAGYARSLYAALHALDDDRCTLIVVERPPLTTPWAAINDRLLRSTR